MTEKDPPTSELEDAQAAPADDRDTPQDAAAAELQALRRERDELNNRMLRLMADYQNLGRRGEQNVAVAREQQSLEIARALVDALDNFDRALEVDAGKVSATDVLTGVTMVRDQMLKSLGRFGVERLEVKPGEAFDPNRHEALMRQKAEGVEAGRVATQLQPGYMLRDKTIRPAKVIVAE